MHDRIADRVNDSLVDLGILADDGQVGATAQLLAHIAHDTAHLLERTRYRHHAQRHRNILQLVGQLAKLARRLVEVIQLHAVQPLEVGRGGNHGLGDNDLADNRHKLVEFGQVDTDQVLLDLMRRRSVLHRTVIRPCRLSGMRRNSLRRRRGNGRLSLILCRCGRCRRRFRLGLHLCWDVVNLLIGLDKA